MARWTSIRRCRRAVRAARILFYMCARRGYMFGQLWVVDPLDGLGFGEGVAANAGAASKKATIATTARINGRAKRRSQDVFGVGGIGGLICSLCSRTLI